MCRRGPAYGVASHEERGDRLLDRLSQAGCACTMVDRPDFINRQLTGACPLIKSPLAKATWTCSNV